VIVGEGGPQGAAASRWAEGELALAPRDAVRRHPGIVHPWYIGPTPEATSSAVPEQRFAVYMVCDERGGAKMKEEILYFDGCPTYLRAEEILRGVLAQEGVEAEVELVAVNTDEEAQRLRFPGSPTIRVDGEDLFPMPDRSQYALGCRMCATPEGLKGSPTATMLRASLANATLYHACRNIGQDRRHRGRRTSMTEENKAIARRV
jgi:hypothetical protein